MKKSIFVILLSLLYSSLAFAHPAQVILIRHAEKPEVNEGSELSERGWDRAQALPVFFKTRKELQSFGDPVALYAMKPKKEYGSIRATQTLKFVAKEYGLRIQNEYTSKDAAELVYDIWHNRKYDGKSVVICWNHDGLPELAELFEAYQAPDTWEGDVYDRAWVLTFEGEKKSDKVIFKDVPQKLLRGDSRR